MNRFTYFEFVSNDPEKTAAFYRDVLGWEVRRVDGPVEYWLLSSGDASTPGINGGLTRAGGPFRAGETINTMEVDDVDAAITRVEANGGAVVSPKTTIPGFGYQAFVRDNAGILIGLHKTDLDAK